ncbi:hypothetical protein B5C34_12830 [Pacificimonas flava]|uniref:Uncharacterized protein n=2 Tax=Pacificimonas TaxID=1960290 RepID=A0A219B7B2_9SPHN|nr:MULTISPECIES: hypothetical protein [Pacificimonas]MBZ6378447.1 hypothetical protein [Pacificimonas aurantium]OWV34255.1 hypothetical protein B5C34_12830 [Pacificimonas flava]
MRRFPLVAVVLATLILSGCARWNSIHRTSPGYQHDSDVRVITVDAKQRHLIMTTPPDSESGAEIRICAEAAPDVFSALAGSGGLKMDVSAASTGELGAAASETAATIQRSQSINLIRESLYRTCERYASGAMGKAQFIVQASRDQRNLVSILAIEQLTGAIRPPATIISGPATQASAISGRKAAELVEDYKERRDAAKASADAAKTELEKAKKEGGVCAEGNGKNPEDCQTLTSKAEAATEDLETAQKGLDDAMAIARALTDSASGATEAGTNSTGGITAADLRSADIAKVAEAVVNIHKTATINEPLMFCLAVLTGDEEIQVSQIAKTRGSEEKIVDACLQVLQDSASAANNFFVQQFSYDPGQGPWRAILENYTAETVPDTELTRRSRLLLAAMQAAGLGQTRGDLLGILAQGTDDHRRRLVEAAIARETNEAALKILKGQ